MKYLFIIFILYLSYQIVRNTGYKRFLYYWIGIIFVPYQFVILQSPYFSSHRFLVFFFVLSMLFHRRKSKKELKNFPLSIPLLILTISHIMTGVMDVRLSLQGALWKAGFAYLETFFLVVIGYCTIEKNNIAQYNRLFYNTTILVGIYGIFTAFIGLDIYTSIMENIIGVKSDFTPFFVPGRTRICSFLFNSHLLGAFMAGMFIILVGFNSKKLFSRKMLLLMFIIICSLILSGSRSSFIAAIGALMIFSLLKYNLKNLLKVILFGCLLILPFFQSSTFQKQMLIFTEILEKDGGKTAGSNINMRENQLAISLYYYKKNPIWGNGFDYFAEVLYHDEEVIKKEGLLGAESYYFSLLIDRGLIQIITISLFFLWLILYFYFKRRLNRDWAALGIALTCLFVVISLMTGNYGKWVFVLPCIGFCLKGIRLKTMYKNIDN